jgi:hypothetical protein
MKHYPAAARYEAARKNMENLLARQQASFSASPQYAYPAKL